MKLVLLSLIISMGAAASPKLSFSNSQIVRSWMVRIINEQLRQGPSPKWVQRDCVGLVDFAFSESIKVKDQNWYKAHGFSNSSTPPDISLDSKEREPFLHWNINEGKRTNGYISAISLVQNNSNFISKDFSQARMGDLVFYDMGDSQHVMVWMGSYLAYHTGSSSIKDNGLRKYHLKTLMKWKDTRWRPQIGNPNYIGLFRLQSFSF